MAHFARIDENNLVVEVLVTDNNAPNEGYDWLIDTFGGRWVKTSYNTFGGVHSKGGEPLRKNYAGIGFFYDESLDAFIPPKPFDSWILNTESCLWEPPVQKPTDDKIYSWDESILNWVEVNL